MTRMPDIERDAADAVARRQRPAPMEGTMTSKIADVARALDAAARHLARVDANPLIGQLDNEGLGQMLKPDEVGAVLTLVRSLEEGRAPAQAADMPQMQP